MKTDRVRPDQRDARRAWGLRWIVVLTAVGLALFAWSCSKKSGSGADGGGGQGGEGNEPGSSAPCEPLGGYRCNPAVPAQLEVCDPATVAGWTYVASCGSADLCDPDLGQCRKCEPGEYRCDAWRLQACTADGSGWTMLTECESAEFCDSRNAQCAECVPGGGYCSGATLFSCNRTQDGFVTRDCGSKDNCSATSMSCRPCIVGEYQCNLEQLQICNEDRKWELVDTCETPRLCALTYEKLLGDESVEPVCEPPVCEAGQFKCGEGDGRNLLGCPPSQAEWQVLDVCETADRCQADLGTCAEGPCLPGDMQCDGIAFQVCNSSGTAWETVKTCASEDQCNVRAGDCVACDPGDVQCNGRNLQECNDDRQWVTRESCASARLCKVDESDPSGSSCVTPQCQRPGDEYRCTQAELQVCNADLAWESVQTCASAALCNSMDGRCNAVGCPSPGTHRCQNNVLEHCPTDLTGWTTVEECASGSTCDLSSLGCVKNCPDARFRCNGTSPEECVEKDDGTIEWQVVSAPCASQGLCWASEDGAGCNFPICGGFFLPDYRCNPNNTSVVERCTPDRTGWEAALTCTGGTTCDPGPNSDGPPQCDICPPNNFDCGNGILTQCDPTGQTIRVLENCGDEAHCVDPPSGSQGYCLRCDSGQTQCNGTNLDTCSSDRRGWVSAQQCDPASGCHDNPGSSDYCNVCRIPRETRCEGSSTLLTCTPEQDAWSSSTNCMFGCQDDHMNDYCRDCAPNSAQCSTSTSTERRVCSDVGKWQNYMSCTGGSECFDAPGDSDYCASCDPGSFVCINQTQIEECGKDGRPLERKNCGGSTPVCLGATNSCVECMPGTAQCSSSGRRVCGSDGFWDAENCTGGQVCLQGNCVACTPGAERCTGSSTGGRQVCSASGVWETRNCTSSSAPYCLNGSCGECNPTTSGPRCTGSNTPGREVCEDGDWTEDDCSGGDVCVSGQCEECDPAVGAQCTGSSGSSGRRVCQGGDWVQANCSGSTPVCQSGACRCEQDATRCSESSGKRQRCTSGQWVDDACDSGVCVDGTCAECGSNSDCPNADFPVCMGGACVCDVGDERCSGSAHQVCRSTSGGNAWSADPCGGDTPLCSGGACVCSNGATRCNQGTLQTCASGSWTNSPGTSCTACTDGGDCGPNSPICTGGICQPCSSSPNNCMNAVCVGGSCVECSASNTSQCESGEVCGPNNQCVPCDSNNTCSGGLVCVGGSCQMGECSDGGQRCSEGVRQVCSDGTWESDPCENPNPVCGSGGVCAPCTQNAQCGTGICSDGSCQPAQCTSGDTQCADSAYQQCVEGKWETAQMCVAPTPVCSASAGCLQCASSSDCGGSTPVCSDNVCVQCTADNTSACGGTTPICSENTCVGCSDNDDCGDLGGTCANDGACRMAECGSGDSRCSGPTFQTCNNGTWESQTTCMDPTPLCEPLLGCIQCLTSGDCGTTTPFCSQNACVECQNGTEQCEGTTHELCMSNSWMSAPCESGQVCDPESGACVESEPAPPGAGGAE